MLFDTEERATTRAIITTKVRTIFMVPDVFMIRTPFLPEKM
jgi:hypothetical protein